MREIFTALLLTGLVFTTYSTVITVSNDPNSIGMYSTVQEAIDAASAGDTVLVAATPNFYSGDIVINKPLALIGGGYTGDFKSYIAGAIFLRPLIGDLSGTVITGLENNGIYSDGSASRNILVRNCKINGNVYFYVDTENYVLENCIIASTINIINSSIVSNVIIRNNIFTNNSNSFYRLNEPSILITNNIILGAVGGTSNAFFDVSNAVITNNIFFFISTGGCDYCTFTDNLSYGGSTTSFTYANNSGNNPLEATDPQFENVPEPKWEETYDYRLKSTSPGKNAGSDGTDIGIYGGNTPYPYSPANPFPNNPVPGIPLISEMNILNGSLEKTDALRVKVTANANNE